MMNVARRLVVLTFVLCAMLLPRSTSASTAACCVVTNTYTKNTMGCLARQVPDSELTKVKANLAGSAATYCNVQIPSVSLKTALVVGACNTLSPTFKCSAPPDQNKAFLDYKTQWDSGGFCAYKSPASTSYDACSEVTGSSCPGAFNYGEGSLFSGPKNTAFCPAANPADFADAVAAGNNDVPGKVTVSDSMQSCVYYVGSHFTDEGVVSCTEPENVQGKMVCDFAPKGQSLQPAPQHPSEIKACQLSQHCCLVYQDTNSDKDAQTSEVLQCNPVNVGCTSAVYSKDASVVTANKADAGAAYDKILYRTDSVQKVCAAVPACTGKIISTEQAMAKLAANASAASAGLTPEQRKELEDASKNGPTWTQALCEVESNNVWAPPDPSITVGPYCLTNPDKAKVNLNIPIGGLSVASLATYIPNLFNYGLGILATMTVLAIIFAGFQWAMAAGNASVIGKSKEMMIGAFAALFVALGSYTLLQTISPNLLEFRLPPIAAILPVEFYGKGDEFICCNERGVCLQVEAKGPNTFVVLKDGTKLGVDGNFDKSTCFPMTGTGEFCRDQGPIGDACRKIGGTCTVGQGEDPMSLLATNDKSQQGWCSVLYNNYLGGAIKGAYDFVDSMTLGLSGALATKGKNAFASEEDLVPGTGELGRCYKNMDKRVAGQYCRGNAECASGMCVRLQDTASCFSDRELGKCSDGRKGDVCNPLGHTLVGGKNTYKQQTSCEQGLTCNFVRSTISGALSDPNSIPGNYYECGDGTLNSACGTVVSQCWGSAGLPAGNNRSCDTQSTLLGNAICNYDKQRSYVETRLSAAGLLSGTQKLAVAVDLVAVGSGMLSSGSFGKFMTSKTGITTAIAAGLTLAGGISNAELERDLAELQAYAYAVAFTDPNTQNCQLRSGDASADLCKSGFTCKKVEGNGGLRCVPENNGLPGAICSYINPEAHEYISWGKSSVTSNGDNCAESQGLRCSVARITFGDPPGNYGYCTNAAWGAPCLPNREGSNLSSTEEFSIENHDCNNTKVDATAEKFLFEKMGSAAHGSGVPVCWGSVPNKTLGDTVMGRCGYAYPMLYESIGSAEIPIGKTLLVKSPGSVEMGLFSSDLEGVQSVMTDSVIRSVGQPCAVPYVNTTVYQIPETGGYYSMDSTCNYDLGSTTIREWAESLGYGGRFMGESYASPNFYIKSGNKWGGICVIDSPQSTQGRCAIDAWNTATKQQTIYAPFEPKIHNKTTGY